MLNYDRKRYVSKLAIFFLFFPSFFSTVCLDFSSSVFCPVSEHFKTVNVFIFTSFPWGGMGLHITQISEAETEAIIYDEHLF